MAAEEEKRVADETIAKKKAMEEKKAEQEEKSLADETIAERKRQEEEEEEKKAEEEESMISAKIDSAESKGKSEATSENVSEFENTNIGSNSPSKRVPGTLLPPAKWNVEEELKEEEKAAILATRKMAPELTEGLNDYELAFYVLGRKLDVVRAVELLKQSFLWQKEFEIDKINYGGIKGILMSGVFHFVDFFHRAKPGCAVAYIYPNRIPGVMLNDLKLMMQTIWFLQTRAAAMHVENMREGWIMVEDFAEITFSQIMKLSSDSKKNKSQMDAMQDHVPGRFRLFLLTNTPWWIRIPMKIMMPFMKSRLREKFILCDPQEVAERLGGLHMVPQRLLDGGTLPPFHPKQILEMFPELEDKEIPVGPKIN